VQALLTEVPIRGSVDVSRSDALAALPEHVRAACAADGGCLELFSVNSSAAGDAAAASQGWALRVRGGAAAITAAAALIAAHAGVQALLTEVPIRGSVDVSRSDALASLPEHVRAACAAADGCVELCSVHASAAGELGGDAAVASQGWALRVHGGAAAAAAADRFVTVHPAVRALLNARPLAGTVDQTRAQALAALPEHVRAACAAGGCLELFSVHASAAGDAAVASQGWALRPLRGTAAAAVVTRDAVTRLVAGHRDVQALLDARPLAGTVGLTREASLAALPAYVQAACAAGGCLEL
jgi:phage-related protein